MNERTIKINLSMIRMILIICNMVFAVTTVSVFFASELEGYVRIIKQALPTISIVLIFLASWFAKIEQKCIMHRSLDGLLSEKKCIGYSFDALQEILKEITANSINNNLPPKVIESGTSKKRIQNRRGLVCAFVVIFFMSLWASICFSKPTIFLMVVCIVILICIYADYFQHVNRYAKEYDRRTTVNEKPNKNRGLAKLYLEEYKKTKFNRDAKFYAEVEYKEHSIGCKRHILEMSIDHMGNSGIIISAFLTFLNLMLTLPLTEQFLLSFFKVTESRARGDFLYNFVYFSIMATTVALNIMSCCQEKNVEDCIKKSLITYMDNDISFNKEYEKNKVDISLLIKYRGVFQFTIQELDENRKIEDIAWEDRMLFVHRMHTHVPRLQLTILLFLLIIVFISISIGGLHWWYLFYVAIALILYQILLKYYLPIVGKKKIITWCERLNKEEEEERQKGEKGC